MRRVHVACKCVFRQNTQYHTAAAVLYLMMTPPSIVRTRPARFVNFNLFCLFAPNSPARSLVRRKSSQDRAKAGRLVVYVSGLAQGLTAGSSAQGVYRRCVYVCVWGGVFHVVGDETTPIYKTELLPEAARPAAGRVHTCLSPLLPPRCCPPAAVQTRDKTIRAEKRPMPVDLSKLEIMDEEVPGLPPLPHASTCLDRLFFLVHNSAPALPTLTGTARVTTWVNRPNA